jgi:iron complex outermembrane receptor protein
MNSTAAQFYPPDDSRVRTPGFLDDLFGTEVLITADQDTTSYAGFGQGEWHITDRLDLITGVRFTHEEKNYVGGTLDQNPFGLSALITPFCPGAALPCQLSFVDTSIEDDFFSWRVGLDWRLNADTLIYGSVSRGQKSGGFFSGITLADAQLAPYSPEELTAYEIGVKWQVPSARVRGEMAAFYYDYSDLQTFIRVDLGPVSVQALGNVPEAQISGVEASLAWEPVDGLTLQAGAGLLSTELGSFSTVAGPVPAGNEIPNAPGLSFNARAIYEWNMGPNLLGRAQIGADFADGAFKDALNDPIIASEKYWLFDARVGIGSPGGDWEIALWGANLTDEQYVVQGLNSGLGAGNRNYNAPRTYGVSLSRRFN